MLGLNPTTLQAVAEKAATDAANYPRWLVAIGRALVELSDNPYIERAPSAHGLIIGSPSGHCYTANGVCGCCAFTGVDPESGKQLHKGGYPCWHRAAARLVRLHDEREAGAAQLAEQVITVVDQSRTARKIAAARATAQLNELFA
jgi:hypothetical protein